MLFNFYWPAWSRRVKVLRTFARPVQPRVKHALQSGCASTGTQSDCLLKLWLRAWGASGCFELVSCVKLAGGLQVQTVCVEVWLQVRLTEPSFSVTSCNNPDTLGNFKCDTSTSQEAAHVTVHSVFQKLHLGLTKLFFHSQCWQMSLPGWWWRVTLSGKEQDLDQSERHFGFLIWIHLYRLTWVLRRTSSFL